MTAPTFGPQWLQQRLVDLGIAARGARLCVAFSGGADSTALLAALARCRRFTLRAVHVNHQLRPGARQWADAALAIAAQLGVPAKVLAVQVHAAGRSLEAAAREARYTALAGELAADEILLTAHHQDDQLETLLLQLLRGAGVAGLAAMPGRAPFAGGLLLRPLLPLTRAALLAYVQRRRLPWTEDDSNTDTRFDRNFLRRQITPLLRERWPAAAATVSRSAAHLAEAQRLLDGMAATHWQQAADGRSLRVPFLRTLPVPARANLLRYWLRQLGLPLPDQSRLRELGGPLLAARADANPVMRWEGAEVHRFDGRLHAFAPLAAAPAGIVHWQWTRQRHIDVPGAGRLSLVDDLHGDLDLARLPRMLELRFRGGGERLPAGSGHQSLKEWLRARQLPPWRRTRLPLIHADGDLIAVADGWLAPAVTATQESARRARFRWEWRLESNCAGF